LNTDKRKQVFSNFNRVSIELSNKDRRKR